MAKGFYMHIRVVLFDRAPAVEALRVALSPAFDVVKPLVGGDDAWFGGYSEATRRGRSKEAGARVYFTVR